MTDFVFSQLEDISNDTFSDFSPYSPSSFYGDSPDHSCSSWNSSMDNSFCENYDGYGGGVDFMSDDVYMAHQEFTSSAAATTTAAPTTMNNGTNNNNNNNMSSGNSSIGGGGGAGVGGNGGGGEPSFPQEIKLRDIDMQDHNGQQLEHRRIADIKLKLFAHFFGLEYNDSFVGKAVSQFFPTDIITVVRQCDRIGIFIQFRRFLTCRKFNDSLYNGFDQPTSPSTTNAEHLYFKDSPFVNCMYMMLEFVDEYHINHVFNYLVSNDRISSNLKMVYNQWMFCAEICTASDVHLISLSLSSGKGDSGKFLQTAINVNSGCEAVRDDDEENTEDDVDDLAERMGSLSIPTLTTAKSTPQLPTRSKQPSPRRRLSNSSSIDNTPLSQQQQRQITWAKSAINNAQKAKNGIPDSTVSSVQIRKKSLSNSYAIISASKMEEVLPPSFALISAEVKEFALQMLREARLQPFQFSVRLCETLAIAQTPQAKLRAKSVLYKLSTYPTPVQLSNASQVARYILGQSTTSSNSTRGTKSAPVSPVPNTNKSEGLPSLQTNPSAVKTKPQRSPQPIHKPPQTTKLDEKLCPPVSKTTAISPAAEQTNKRKNSLTLAPPSTTGYGGESPLSGSGKQQNGCRIS